MRYAILLAFVLAATASGDVIKVTVTPTPEDGTFAAPRKLIVDVVNLSEKSIDVTSATLRLPAWYDADPRGSENALAGIEGDLDARHTGTDTVELPQLSTREAFLPIFKTPPLFFYKKLRGTVTIRYKYANESTEQEPIRYDFTLPADAPLWHVLFGGLCGTILAFGIAAIAYKTRSSIPKIFWHSVVLALLSVPLIILLARLSTSFLPFPVEIDLRDAAGGFLLGVFSLWFTPKLVENFLGSAPKPREREREEQSGGTRTEEHTKA